MWLDASEEFSVWQNHDISVGTDEMSLGFLAPPTRLDALGRLGHNEVLQVLGRGGFGIVFRAFDRMLERVVTLKVMAPLARPVLPVLARLEVPATFLLR